MGALRTFTYVFATVLCGLLVGGATGWIIGLQAGGEETPYYGLYIGGIVGITAAIMTLWLMAHSRRRTNR